MIYFPDSLLLLLTIAMVSIVIAPIPDIEEINGNLYGVLTIRLVILQ